MDEKLLNEITKHLNESKRNFRFEQAGLNFLTTVERSTTTKIDTIKNDIIMPKSKGRVNPFFMPITNLAKIYYDKKNIAEKSTKAS